MPDVSDILALPYLAPSQAQKHVTHNEALLRLDILVQLVVEAFGADTPPALPEDGTVYALGAAPTGDWAGQGDMLAARVDGAWLFIAPKSGWRAWGRADGDLRVWDGAVWNALEGELDNLDGIGIATTSDATNRLAISSPATLLSHAGDDHQLKINKAATGDTGSLLYQTGWSGRAELGLAGNDDFALKVSPNGSSWHNALVADAGTGHVGIGVTSPAAPLHVGDLMRLEPASAPASPAAGDIYFDSTTSKLRCHDGTGWNDLF